MQRSESDAGNPSDRAKTLAAHAADPDPNARYRALEEARRLPPAVRAEVARHYSADSSIWIRALAEAILEPPRGLIRSRPALLHELDEILRGTSVGTRQRAGLARLLEDAQSLGSTGDLALAADRASRLVTQALSDVRERDHRPLQQLRTFLTHVAAYAKPLPVSPKATRVEEILADVTVEGRELVLTGDPKPAVNQDAVGTALRELMANAAEADAALIDVNSTVDGPVVSLRVSNNGPALRDRDVSNLFRPWFTTKEGHAGLGLYLAQVALGETGGDIQLIDQQPVTFRITTPEHR